MPKALLLIVRRGALASFHNLKRKSADLRVVLEWDRREGDRRRAAGAAAQDRRVGDRRRRPPFTWDLADFVVAGETETGDDQANDAAQPSLERDQPS
jgi:hypothetical protein